eukprot:TRINITY_DN1481_c0_g1_i1.p2 TRINITY_DN1481_c0_g1~~TRINITY_DN1481_c0_g1_i1.p2  ORF type:complete len:301 (-),score=21.95 TRINITY_DN1481_c0_g1_i1:336-1208(-)
MKAATALYTLRLCSYAYINQRKVKQKCQERPVSTQVQASLVRRDLVLFTTTTISLLPLPELTFSTTKALEGSQLEKPDNSFKYLKDEQLAYQFGYPLQLKSGTPLNLIFSRKPEKYSSAAPLTADSRQRIVCEMVDFSKEITLSLTVGPASNELNLKPIQEWAAKEVATQVLADKSNAKNSLGQRIPISQLQQAAKVTKDGRPYYIYEHIQQGSPNIMNPDIQTYRRALAVTAVRPASSGKNYLYTFNIAAPEQIWMDLDEAAKQSLASFQLLAEGQNFIDPEKNPWQFF